MTDLFLSSDECLDHGEKGISKPQKRAGKISKKTEKALFHTNNGVAKSSSSSSPLSSYSQSASRDELQLPPKRPFPQLGKFIDASKLMINTPTLKDTNVSPDPAIDFDELVSLESDETTPSSSEGPIFKFRDTLLPGLNLSKGTDSKPIMSHVSASRASSLMHAEVVEHVLFVVHGIGAVEFDRAKQVELLRDNLEIVRQKYFWQVGSAMHVELVDWKQTVADSQQAILDRVVPRIQPTTLSNTGGKTVSSNFDIVHQLSSLLHQGLADVGFYGVEHRKQALLSQLTAAINAQWRSLKSLNPRKFRNAKITVVGHSLGSVLLYDLLSQSLEITDSRPHDVHKLKLEFPVHAFFLLGSPLGAYLSLQENPSTQNDDRVIRVVDQSPSSLVGRTNSTSHSVLLRLPRRLEKFYNVFHASDALAFRLEPLFYGETAEESAPPVPLTTSGNAHAVLNEPSSLADSNSVKPGSEDKDKALPQQHVLPHKRRLDFYISNQERTALSFLPGRIAAGIEMLSAHSAYWTSQELAVFIFKSLTGFSPVLR